MNLRATITVDVKPEQYMFIEEYCKKNLIYKSELIRQLVEEFIANHEISE